MDIYQPERRSTGRARERVMARQRKGDQVPRSHPINQQAENPPAADLYVPRAARLARERYEVESVVTASYGAAPKLKASPRSAAAARAGMLWHDFLWHARRDWRIPAAIVGVIAAVVLVFVGTYVLGGRSFPNLWALGINIGGMTVDEAAAALQTYWDRSLLIHLVDEDAPGAAREWAMTPAALGLRLDARATAEAARAAGMRGLPFGHTLDPVLELDVLRAQNVLLDMTETTKIVPYNAGYQWQGDTLVGVRGTDGRFLDVAATMTALQDDLISVAEQGRLALVMNPVSPDILDPTPYLAQAEALTRQPFQIVGYDPFRDERIIWTTDRDTFTNWIEVGQSGLTLRETAFVPFLNAQTESLASTDSLRYLEPVDALDSLRSAIANGQNTVQMRVRYRTTTYTVEGGDSGYRIARQLGVPFYLLQDANPGRDWDQMLVPGEVMNLPSPDAVVTLPPVAGKRIVVDIDTQTLWAYENGQLVFNWLISTGMDHAPTSPGIYQILSHAETATGSSIELCGNNTCGTWEMYWFMGVYEVFPGLVNGFHGAVLLPNQTYMGDGQVGRQFTYGCVMSVNDQAELLYRWADEGTMVEIVSSEYAPRSELARRSLETGLTYADRPFIAWHLLPPDMQVATLPQAVTAS